MSGLFKMQVQTQPQKSRMAPHVRADAGDIRYLGVVNFSLALVLGTKACAIKRHTVQLTFKRRHTPVRRKSRL